jgi:hypothetical protein
MGPGQAYFMTLSTAQFPSGMGYEQYVLQAALAKSIFQSVFNVGGANRGGEIKMMLNTHTADVGQTVKYLNFAQAHSIAVDAIAITMYINPDGSPQTLEWCWSGTDEQICDFYSHDMFYCWRDTSQNTINTAIQEAVDAYNSATGNNCILFGYETDCAAALEATITTLSGAITNSQTTINVASSAGMVVGEYLILDTNSAGVPNSNAELVQLTGISGNTLTLARGSGCLNGNNGLALVPATAIAHADGISIVSCCGYRADDICYNPQFRQCTLDFFAFCQKWIRHGNSYAFDLPTGEGTMWCTYHWQGQQPGVGDGSDGKADNRLCLAYPGQPHTKATTTSQDATNVSVRGQAFLDWMKATLPAVPPVSRKLRFVPRSRLRVH